MGEYEASYEIAFGLVFKSRAKTRLNAIDYDDDD